MGSYLFKLFDMPLLGKLIQNSIVKREGGKQRSLSLRKYVEKKYNVFVGMYSYGGCFDPSFNIGGKVVIGKYCSIASDVHYFGANHPMNRISMSPFFYNKDFGFEVEDVPRGTLVVGNDVWIGYGVLITNGCKRIGDGAVIAAGSVVTSDVEPYSIVAGVPAKQIKKRFADQAIHELMKTKWYDKTPEELMVYYGYMENPDEFVKRISIEMND